MEQLNQQLEMSKHLIFPPEIKEQFKLCINNIRYLMYDLLNHTLKENYEKVYNAFKKKLNNSVCLLLNWYKTYKKCIPDALLMIIEQEMKINTIKPNLNNRIQILNYNIQIEILNFMNYVYNLYPNL